MPIRYRFNEIHSTKSFNWFSAVYSIDSLQNSRNKIRIKRILDIFRRDSLLIPKNNRLFSMVLLFELNID